MSEGASCSGQAPRSAAGTHGKSKGQAKAKRGRAAKKKQPGGAALHYTLRSRGQVVSVVVDVPGCKLGDVDAFVVGENERAEVQWLEVSVPARPMLRVKLPHFDYSLKRGTLRLHTGRLHFTFQCE